MRELNLQQNKNDFKELLLSTNRNGIDSLLSYLENNTDFFVAPAANKYHSNCKGGLCYHSLIVYDLSLSLIKGLNDFEETNIDNNSLIISCLLHDLCKINNYVIKEKVYKNEETNQWVKYWTYDFAENKFPCGHGEKSLYLVQNFIKVTPNEALAIRWHKGMFTDGCNIDQSETKRDLVETMKKSMLTNIVYTADMLAACTYEKVYDHKTEPVIF